MLSNLPVRVRNMMDEDKNFILNSWLKSFRNCVPVKWMENPAYFKEQGEVIEDLLDKCVVRVACNSGDSQQIYGYLVCEKMDDVLNVHYLYVKQPFRLKGIGKLLMKSTGHKLGKEPGVFTHRTIPSRELGPRFRFMYNPYVTFYPREKDETNYAAIDD